MESVHRSSRFVEREDIVAGRSQFSPLAAAGDDVPPHGAKKSVKTTLKTAGRKAKAWVMRRARRAMATRNQKKWLTDPKGKLAKADVVAMLRKDEAWAALSREKREEIYAYFPEPKEDEEPYDVDVNPMHTKLTHILEDNILRFHKDLSDGKETKAWRDNALKASTARREEGWDAMRKKHRKEERAKREAANQTESAKKDDDGNADGEKVQFKDDAGDLGENAEA